jgi:hypothetical protein
MHAFDVYVCVSRRADLNTLKSEMTKVKEEADAVAKQVCPGDMVGHKPNLVVYRTFCQTTCAGNDNKCICLENSRLKELRHHSWQFISYVSRRSMSLYAYITCTRHMHIRLSARTHTQAETDVQSHRDRADAAELEKNALKQQVPELREKLFKAQSDLENATTTMESMVPRCVCCVCVVCVLCVCVFVYMHAHVHS